MPSGDSRKDFIFGTAATYFGVSKSDDSLGSLHDKPALNDFLDDGAVMMLVIQMDGKKLTIQNKVLYLQSLGH